MNANTRGVSPREKLRLQQELAQRRKRERRVLAVLAIGLVVVIVGGGIALQAWRSHRAPAAGVPSSSLSATPQPIENGKPILLGKADAPVKTTLYEDFHCPHCAEFEDEFASTLAAEQSSGTAAIELYPMSFIDQGSATAANAMACAAENGFGQNYYLGLFANHTLQWQDSQLLQLASQVTGTVPGGFTTCVTHKQHAAWVDSINAAAQANGVDSTPTMFIGKNPVNVSTLTPATLKTMIEQDANK
jgi:protein-disulfide isomerase